MRTSGASLFPLVLLGLLAGATLWLERATQVEDGGRDGKSRHDPDFIVEDFHVRRFGTDGLLQHSLWAKKMAHYPDDDSTDVVLPRLLYHRVPPTQITAQTAWLDKDGKHVRLEGDVHVRRENERGRPATEIVTDRIYAVPDDETAHGDLPVTITQGATIIKGAGLDVDNKARLSVLSGPVRGIIHRNQIVSPKHESIQHDIQTPVARATSLSPAQPVRRAAGARGKGGQGQAGQPRSRPHHGR